MGTGIPQSPERGTVGTGISQTPEKGAYLKEEMGTGIHDKGTESIGLEERVRKLASLRSQPLI
jgi:hypothetical protein